MIIIHPRKDDNNVGSYHPPELKQEEDRKK